MKGRGIKGPCFRVSNILLGDEGLGVRLVEHLNRDLPQGVALVDRHARPGTDALMEDFDRVIIVDALAECLLTPRRIDAGDLRKALHPLLGPRHRGKGTPRHGKV